jgi:uncharacterized coiled-coil protein SlyX
MSIKVALEVKAPTQTLIIDEVKDQLTDYKNQLTNYNLTLRHVFTSKDKYTITVEGTQNDINTAKENLSFILNVWELGTASISRP